MATIFKRRLISVCRYSKLEKITLNFIRRLVHLVFVSFMVDNIAQVMGFVPARRFSLISYYSTIVSWSSVCWWLLEERNSEAPRIFACQIKNRWFYHCHRKHYLCVCVCVCVASGVDVRNPQAMTEFEKASGVEVIIPQALTWCRCLPYTIFDHQPYSNMADDGEWSISFGNDCVFLEKVLAVSGIASLSGGATLCWTVPVVCRVHCKIRNYEQIVQTEDLKISCWGQQSSI
jgi:hypothetical protein